MITDEPNVDVISVIGGFLLYLGGLFVLTVLHLLSLGFVGSVADVMRTLFLVMLGVYVVALIFGIVFVIINLFRWLTYQVTTPKWLKDQRRGGQVGR